VAGLKSKGDQNSWSISVASGSAAKNMNKVGCDIYLAWLPMQERFIEINGDFFLGSKSKSKTIPKQLFWSIYVSSC